MENKIRLKSFDSKNEMEKWNLIHGANKNPKYLVPYEYVLLELEPRIQDQVTYYKPGSAVVLTEKAKVDKDDPHARVKGGYRIFTKEGGNAYITRDTVSRFLKHGTPILIWHDENETASGGENFGWELRLVGSPNIIAFAPWDDEEAISKMVDSLKDLEGLHIQQILMNPNYFESNKELLVVELPIVDSNPGSLGGKSLKSISNRILKWLREPGYDEHPIWLTILIFSPGPPSAGLYNSPESPPSLVANNKANSFEE